MDYYNWIPGIEANAVSSWFHCDLAIALNYIYRAGAPPEIQKNPPAQDIQKAIDHLNFYLQYLEKKNGSQQS